MTLNKDRKLFLSFNNSNPRFPKPNHSRISISSEHFAPLFDNINRNLMNLIAITESSVRKVFLLYNVLLGENAKSEHSF